MKLPGVAIAALFLTGIALGLHPLLARHATSQGFILGSFLGAALFLCVGIICAKNNPTAIRARNCFRAACAY